MKNLSFYGIISIIGFAVRTFLLPNPFKSLGENAEAINLIAGFIIPTIAYISVGVFYTKGSAPSIGSLCFIIVYALIVGIIHLIGVFNFRLWAIILFATLYIIIILFIRFIKGKIRVYHLTKH